MVHDLFHVLGILGVEDVEEVLSRWALVIRKIIREIDHHFFVVCKLRPEILDRQFIVLRNMNGNDILLELKPLLFNKNKLKKVFVDLRLRREVELN